jgi:hypothetical protein
LEKKISTWQLRMLLPNQHRDRKEFLGLMAEWAVSVAQVVVIWEVELQNLVALQNWVVVQS